MRIPTSRQPKSYLNPKDQRRLFALIGVLLVVLIASRMAANPANWNWMFRGQQQPDDAAKSSPEKPDEQKAPLKSGEFHASSGDQQQPPLARKTGGETRTKQVDGATVTTFGPGPRIDPASIEIHSSLLKSVEDRSWNVRSQESGIYFSILAHAAHVSQRDLQRVARDNVPLTVLMSSSQEYRGAAITVDGELLRIRRHPDTLPAEEGKPKGQPRPLFDAWIRPHGSDRTPYRVVFSELPEGVEPVEDSYDFKPPVPVRATGYFFKVQKYEIDDDRDGFAPLLLAKRIRILNTPATSHRTLSAAPYIVGFIIFVLAALALAIWRFSVGDREFHQKHLERIAEPTPTEKVALEKLSVSENEDLFGHLKEVDRPTEGN